MTQQQRVLTMLQNAGAQGVTSGEFYGSFLPRFSARILELRGQGHNITSERLADSSWRYTLIPAVSPGSATTAPASYPARARNGVHPSPPRQVADPDKTAEAAPDGSTHNGLNDSTSGAADGQLFELKPLSPYSSEAA